jgi:hypothetical protein
MPPSGLVPSDCAVWSLIRNRSPYDVASQHEPPVSRSANRYEGTPVASGRGHAAGMRRHRLYSGTAALFGHMLN